MADDDEKDPTAPFNELESFDSAWQALRWAQVKKRVPICFRKTIRNRYFLANIVYLIYAIGILLVDFDPRINGGDWEEEETGGGGCSCNETFVSDTTTIALATTTVAVESGMTLLNRMYLGLACVHLLSASLYWWAWKDHRWNDVVMIPEYLNHIEAALYLWAAIWYQYEDGNYGFYTLALHKIETVAAFVELFASFGWIMSWYRAYTRTIGRGYTLDDPDTIAYTLTALSSFVYIAYNIQILTHPEQYGDNDLYYTGDIMYSVGSVFYLLANLRDDGWLWWFPVAGQYGIAAGRMQTGKAIKAGKSHLLIGGPEPITRCFRKCARRNSEGGTTTVVPIVEQPVVQRVEKSRV